jgi:hypothetical protein
MVLRNSGRVGSCRFIKESCSLNNEWDSFFICIYTSFWSISSSFIKFSLLVMLRSYLEIKRE